jgi:NhaP-type Na+/H+ or K+/H+ antiporter
MSLPAPDLLAIGLMILGVAWVPLAVRDLPLSVPIIALGLGLAIGMLGGPRIGGYVDAAQYLLQTALIVAVMGAGLKIDRRFSFRAWNSAWRLLAIAMPLSIAAIAGLGMLLLGLPLATALLLGAILAPTDPVLAASVQVGPPGRGEEGETRFALTSEAALNDGLAFPFVILALVLAAAPATPETLLVWLGRDLIWNMLGGAMAGIAFGYALVRLNRALPERFQLSQSGDGLAALGLALLAYGLAELVHANGFVAVFASAATMRNVTERVDYAVELHDFAEQVERLATVFVIALFGAMITIGLARLSFSWPIVVMVLATLFLVRPIAALASFAGSDTPRPVRFAAGYFGIRGLGSLYYAIYAGGKIGDGLPEPLWPVITLVVLLSIVVYGLSADHVMGRLDRMRLPAAPR